MAIRMLILSVAMFFVAEVFSVLFVVASYLAVFCPFCRGRHGVWSFRLVSRQQADGGLENSRRACSHDGKKRAGGTIH